MEWRWTLGARSALFGALSGKWNWYMSDPALLLGPGDRSWLIVPSSGDADPVSVYIGGLHRARLKCPRPSSLANPGRGGG